MRCIEYGCMIYEKSKKENRGCLEVLGDDCKNCCRCDPPRSEEELKALEIGDCLQFGQEKYYEKLYHTGELEKVTDRSGVLRNVELYSRDVGLSSEIETHGGIFI